MLTIVGVLDCKEKYESLPTRDFIFGNCVDEWLLFNGKEEEVGRNSLTGNFCLPGPRQESATPYPLAAELDPGKSRRRPQGLNFESQGVEEKENSFRVQLQTFNT